MNTEQILEAMETAVIRRVKDDERTGFNVNTLKFDPLIWDFFNIILLVWYNSKSFRIDI